MTNKRNAFIRLFEIRTGPFIALYLVSLLIAVTFVWVSNVPDTAVPNAVRGTS